MNRALICGPLVAALCLSSVAPAAAEDYRFAGFDAPRGATATVNLRVPLGPTTRRRPSVGVALAYGRPVGAPDSYGGQQIRRLSLADFRLDGSGPGRLRVAGADPQTYDEYLAEQEESGGKKGTLLLVFMTLAGMTTLYLLLDNDDSEESPSEPSSPGIDG